MGRQGGEDQGREQAEVHSYLDFCQLLLPFCHWDGREGGRVQGELVASQCLCLGAGSSGALPVQGHPQNRCCEAVRAT